MLQQPRLADLIWDIKSKCVEGFLPPEHPIFNPADQSVDKSPCRPSAASEYNIAVKKILEECSARTSEESPLPKTGREKLASLLADLLGFPGADRQPEATTNTLNLYESMSPRLELRSAPSGTCAPSQDPQRDKRAVIYENCLKCRGERCHPPPRAAPADMYRNRNISTRQSGNGLRLKKSQEHEVASNEEVLCAARGDGSQSEDGRRQYEEMNGRTVTSEGKRPPLQFPPQLSFSDSSGVLFLFSALRWILSFVSGLLFFIISEQKHFHFLCLINCLFSLCDVSFCCVCSFLRAVLCKSYEIRPDDISSTRD